MSSDKDGGSFITGFSLGLFAGAAGYFLFATDRGEKVRQELLTEWEAAKERLAEEGHDFPSEISESAEEMLNQQVKPKALQLKKALQQAVSNWLELDKEAEERNAAKDKKAKAKKTTSKKTSSSASSSKSKKFKGV